MKFPLASTCNSPNFVGVEKSQVDAGVNGFSPPPAIVMKSLASKIGMLRAFKRKVTEDLTFAPILITRPSLVVMVSDVSPLSTLTQPSFGIPAIDETPSTTFSKPDVSFGIREFGSVVVVVGATVVVVVVGATVVEVVVVAAGIVVVVEVVVVVGVFVCVVVTVGVCVVVLVGVCVSVGVVVGV